MLTQKLTIEIIVYIYVQEQLSTAYSEMGNNDKPPANQTNNVKDLLAQIEQLQTEINRLVSHFC